MNHYSGLKMTLYSSTVQNKVVSATAIHRWKAKVLALHHTPCTFTRLLCGTNPMRLFTRLVTVVIAVCAQYHSCCYQNRFTTITNALALASPCILEDVSVLKSCYLHCETPQHEILSERVHSRSCSRCDGHLLFQEGLGSSLARCATFG